MKRLCANLGTPKTKKLLVFLYDVFFRNFVFTVNHLKQLELIYKVAISASAFRPIVYSCYKYTSLGCNQELSERLNFLFIKLTAHAELLFLLVGHCRDES
jgi:hypothetical protein